MAAFLRLVGGRRDGEGVRGQTVDAQRQEPDEDVLTGLPGDDGPDADLEQAAGEEIQGGGVQAVEEMRSND